jgi:hypothetical protein
MSKGTPAWSATFANTSVAAFVVPAEFKPVQRELVIDIDMTDYDELRTCGSGGHICSRCWPFIAVAIQVSSSSSSALDSVFYFANRRQQL